MKPTPFCFRYPFHQAVFTPVGFNTLLPYPAISALFICFLYRTMINKRFLLWFTLAIALVITVGITAYSALKKQAGQEGWVEHTYQIINRADKFARLVIDMETGQRGFRATGDASYLEHYRALHADLTVSVDSLKSAIQTNDEEVGHVDQLRSKVNQLDQFWQSQSTGLKKPDPELNRNITAREKELTDGVLTDVNAVGIAAQHLLAERQKEKKGAMQQAVITISIGTLLILFVVGGLIRLVILEYRSRTRAEKDLNDKYEELNQVNEVTNSTNWLLDGLRRINDSLMGNDTLDDLVQNFLDALSTYLKLPCAVCYTYDAGRHQLVCAGSVAISKDNLPPFKPGEGLAGAAATRRHITVIEEIPAGYWQINSGTGAAAPDTLIFLPLWKKNDLIGVIEFGCFGQSAERVVALLQDMSVNIALGISSAQMLSITQDQRNILEVQQEELRQSNEELQVQTEELQASQEELRVKEEELTMLNLTLEEKTESLEVAALEMQRKNDDLERSGKYKSEFLANMSHELRTPLNSILILTALMQENKDQNLSDRQRENLRIVYQSGSDLLTLINDILDLSKIEAGKVEFMVDEFAVSDMADDMKRAFTAVAEKKQVRFLINTTNIATAKIHTDRQRLGQVVKNLLSNAFKFTPHNGKVELTFEAIQHTLNISVSDTGVGIPVDKQQLIFEAFQQADGATTRRYGGTGLGLSISKELISRLGGRIGVQSAVGTGSAFTVSMPLNAANLSAAEPDEAPSTITEQTQIKDDRTALVPSQRSILIIEDDVNFARTVNDYAADRGFKTIIALSGDEGLFYARKYRPSAIVLDLGLPVISGQHILKILKGDPELQHIPVHVISAMDGLGLPSDGIESFVQKPVNPQQLALTFGSIETYIRQHYKKVLILSDENSILRPFLVTLSESNLAGTIYDITNSFEGALDILKARDADCLVIDIGKDYDQALQQLQKLHAAAPDVHIIACFDHQPGPDAAKRFQPYTNTLIGPSEQAGKRLLDEVELFLHRMSERNTVKVPEQFSGEPDTVFADKTILLADDDMRNIYALSALLEGHGMHIITAEHGREAVELLNRNPEIDLVLMDIMMPEMDGYEATRQIRSNPKNERLPIIALTAKAMLGDREKCLAAGASDYITKPVNNQQLLSLLRVWLSAK